MARHVDERKRARERRIQTSLPSVIFRARANVEGLPLGGSVGTLPLAHDEEGDLGVRRGEVGRRRLKVSLRGLIAREKEKAGEEEKEEQEREKRREGRDIYRIET
jgi:hypothetical protein